MEKKQVKFKWMTPKLIVLLRDNNMKERVLAACKRSALSGPNHKNMNCKERPVSACEWCDSYSKT